MRDVRRHFRPRLAFSAGWRGRGDAEATAARVEADRFRETMLVHMDAAYNLARYLARDPDAAEDIVQSAFLRAFRAFGTFRGDSPKAWLFAILRNCFLDWCHARRDDPMPIDEAPDGTAEIADEETPEAILARSRDAERVRGAVADLPEPFREAIVLRELEELSYKEIAMITGVPIGTVMSRLARGRQMLCATLQPEADRRSAAS